MKQITVILLFLLFVPSFSETLESLIEEALQNSPKVRAVRQESSAAEQQIDINKKIPELVISGGYFINEVETRVGPQKGKIGASQMIPWPGKLSAQKKVAESGHSVSLKKVSAVESEIAASVRKSWDQLWLVGQQINIKEKSNALLAHQQEILLTRYTAGTVSQSALLKIEVARGRLFDEISSLNSEAIRIREQLRTALNRDSIDNQFWPEQKAQLPLIDLPDSSLIAGSPLYLLSERQVETADLKVSAAKQQFAPSIMVMTDYIFTDEIDNGMVSPEENGKDPWIVGASVTIPLWAKSRSAGVKQAESESAARQEQVTSVKLQLESQLVVLRETIADADRKIVLYAETIIPRAEQTLTLIEEEYRQNSASVLDYLDAQQTLLTLELLLVQQETRRNLALSDIYQIAGWITAPMGGNDE